MVEKSDGERIATKLAIPFIETSAKEGDNIHTAFDLILEKILILDNPTVQSEIEERTTLRNSSVKPNPNEAKGKCC
jgi:hypothetical protein